MDIGCDVKFYSYRGNSMKATVVGPIVGQMVNIHITNDPFPTFVDRAQLQRVGNTKERKMPETAVDEMNPRQLRQQAREQGLSNWEVMEAEELRAALKESSPSRKKSDTKRGSSKSEAKSAADTEGDEAPMPTKRTTKTAAPKKAPATKAAPSKRTPAKAAPAKKATPAARSAAAKSAAEKKTRRAAPTPPADYDGPNPFRPGSNLFKITEVLLVGGNNKDLVKKLAKQLEYKPRVKTAADFDVEAETDRRMKIVGYILRNEHGFEYIYDTSEGRGENAFIKVVPPAA